MGMSPVTADGLAEDSRLGLIPTHPCPQPIRLQPQKGPQGQKQMTQNGDGFAHLRPLHPTTLLQPSRIDFNPPSLFLQLLSFLLRHLPVMGRPVFRVPVWGNRPKYPDEPNAFPMRHPPLRWDFPLPNRPIPLPIRIHQTVALQGSRSPE